MAEIFEPTALNGVTLSNRFVRSATWEGLAAPGGYATEELGRLWMGLAQGEVGLIITGLFRVENELEPLPLLSKERFQNTLFVSLPLSSLWNGFLIILRQGLR